MELNLHANATTTPKVRAYIQGSKRSVAELAVELGVSETTIRRWRERRTVGDRSHTPKRLAISLSPMEEALVCELRTRLALPLDDIVEVMRRCLNPKLSRSAIHRCLKRHGINRRPKPDKPPVGVFEQASTGFIHIDLKHLPALERRKSYAFVAIDRATRYVYVEIHPNREAKTAAAFLERFLADFPHPVHTILTDNGSEFTDRFAVDMKHKPHDRPSGRHPFDRLCAERGIEHRLTRPYRPQTNGLVERFNRRIVEAIGRQPKRGIAHRLFASHAKRDAFLLGFVRDYNRTRLKCLGYLAPLQALANPPGPNTQAGHPALAAICAPAIIGDTGSPAYVGNYREATRHYRQTIARQPKWEGLYDGLGWSRYRLQRYHLAAEAFQQALALHPRYRDASVGLAYSLFESERYAEALPLLERMTREGEGYTPQQSAADVEEVRGRLAWTLFYLGKYEEAKAEFTKGIAARPDWYGLYNGLGWTCLKLGDHVRARQSFRQALRLKPGYADAKAGLAEVRR